MEAEITVVDPTTGEVVGTRADALRRLMREWWQPPAELLGTKPRAGITLTFLGHADTTRALIEADPTWTWAPMATDDHGPIVERDDKGRPVGMWITLTVCGVTRPAYGSCEPNAPEPIKELIGDAIRNGAMRFGVAGGLWSKADWTITDEQVRSLVALAKAMGLSNDDAARIIREHAGVGSSREIPVDRFDDVMDALKRAAPDAVEVAKEELNAEVIAA